MQATCENGGASVGWFPAYKLFLIASSVAALLAIWLLSSPSQSTQAFSHPELDLPLFVVTIDEADPAQPDMPPTDDQCPLNVPCKIQTFIAIGPNEPLVPIAMITPPPFFVAPGATIPDGAPVGLASFQVVVAPGSCDGDVIPASGQALLRDATIEPTTTSGSPLDLIAIDRWDIVAMLPFLFKSCEPPP